MRRLASGVDGVIDTEKCRIRKIGLHLALDIHVVVDFPSTEVDSAIDPLNFPKIAFAHC